MTQPRQEPPLKGDSPEDSTPAGADHTALLEVRNLTQQFVVRGSAGAKAGTVQAVSGVSFQVSARETLGVVGETGCGKSSMARAVLQAPRPVAGEVIFKERDLVKAPAKELRAARQHIQMVFQDPYGSLDPRWPVSRAVEEPLRVHRVGTTDERRKRVADLLDLVGLDPSRYGARKPRELSGGQCQRVAIARALVLFPQLVICDEAVSSLDVSVQAQILNLFERLKAELGLAYLFIAHDLAVVNHVSDRVAVMYLGKLCEVGPPAGLYSQPLHPYTAALVAAIPKGGLATGGERPSVRLSGEPPSPMDPPSGCRFRTRCPSARERCAVEEPALIEEAPGRWVACHFPLKSEPGRDHDQG